MKTGVYGGSFDPIHAGHAAMARYVAENAGLDRVMMLVSPLNPLKTGAPPMFSDEERLSMAREAMKGTDRVEVSGFEMDLPRPSYTLQTLEALSKTFPDDDFSLVIGADNLLSFNRWKEPEKLLRRFGLIVYPRPGVNLTREMISGIENEYGSPGKIVYLADAPVTDISSTSLRRKLTEGSDLRGLIPEGALRVIKDSGRFQIRT